MLGIIGTILLLIGLPSPLKDAEELEKELKELEDTISELNDKMFFLTGKHDSGTRLAKRLERMLNMSYWTGLICCLIQIGMNVYNIALEQGYLL